MQRLATSANSHSAGMAISADEISVSLDAASLAASPIVLTEASVRGLLVNLEVTEGGLNALTLSRNVDRARPEQADAVAEETEPRRFRIRTLRFEQGTLRVDASAVGREVREVPLEAFNLLCRTEGIIPALESSHAIAHLRVLGKELPAGSLVLACLSGRGDKDLNTVLELLAQRKAGQ